MNEQNNNSRDLVLAPGEYAYVLDTTKGLVNTLVGPNKNSMSNTDQPVVWDRSTRKFKRVDMQQAIQTSPVAPEGFYIALYNPAKSGDNVNQPPREGSSAVSIPLNVGHRVNIPGPVTFPLWPGQFASVIQGHHLRSNQYLLVQVYNDAEATANWQRAVVKPATPSEGDAPTAAIAPPLDALAPGKLLVIRGTDVSFFIPPTGIKVVAETSGSYIREAVTLERLEYCILLDEDGNKRFIQGPNVVFPEPTETFVEKDGSRKFRAIELNENSGLYIKVIADYEENGQKHKVGDELFITGKEQAIYFQREEHSIIRYGDQTKHYAVAIPPGEGRYVLNRNSGEVRLERGPQMLLCDPRKDVIIRRVLTPKEVTLWYPGNAKALQVNQELEALSRDPGVESMPMGASAYEVGRPMAANLMGTSNYLEREDRVRSVSRQVAGDTFARGTKFTPPRTVTLDTKYDGAVAVNVWPGYAIMVVNKTGDRRVVEGPETVLLEYDETLSMMELSTGTPKTDDNLLNTVYLRVRNNKVSDRFTVETQDLVKVTLTLSYRLNFEGDDKEKWFSVENYVRLLCDHMRSLIRNTAKRSGIADFYGNTINIVRDATLGVAANGGQRPGRIFDENGMHVYDVEVLDIGIQDQQIGALLGTAQREALTSALTVAKARRELEDIRILEDIKRNKADEQKITAIQLAKIEREQLADRTSLELEKVTAEFEVLTKRMSETRGQEAVRNELNALQIERDNAVSKAKNDNRMAELTIEAEQLKVETDELVKRANAVSPALATALTTFSDQALIAEISKSLAPLSAMSGVSQAEVLARLFKGTAFEGVMSSLASRSRVPQLTE